MVTRSMLPLLLLFVAGLVTGCGSGDETTDTLISTAGYDKSCTTNADCKLVFVGNVCGCDCTQEPINASEVERFNQEVGEKSAQCDMVLTCAPCSDRLPPVCSAGVCAAQ